MSFGFTSLNRLRWQVLRSLTPRRVVSSRGLKFTLQSDNWITHYRWQTFNTKEPEMLDWIDQYCRPGDIFFDIGANIGLYSVYAALRHPGIRVFAFEPEFANLHLLRDNVVANSLQDRITIYSLGLGSQTTLSQLHVQDLTPGAALHTESLEPLYRTASGGRVILREGISVYTLDEFCQMTQVYPHTIKLDVDGTETSVLQGALRTLQSPTLRSLIAEISTTNGTDQRCHDLLDRTQLKRSFEKPVEGACVEIWLPRVQQSNPAGNRVSVTS
jgi:FkbM family methyltransferase